MNLKKLNIKNLLIFGLSLLSCIMLAIILFVRLTLFTDKTGNVELDLESLFPGRLLFSVDQNEAKDYYPLSESLFLRAGTSNSSFVSHKGEELLNLDFSFNSPYILTKGNSVFVSEQNANHYTVFNKKGLLYRGKTEHGIIQAAISTNAELALLLDDKNHKGLVRLLNSEGKQLFDLHIQDEISSGFVTDMFFDEEKHQLIIAMFNLNASNPFPVINIYSTAKNTLGQLIAEHKPNLRHAMIQITKDRSDKLISFSTKEAIAFNSSGEMKLIEYANLYYGGVYNNTGFVLAQTSEGSNFRFITFSTNDNSENNNKNIENAYLLPGQIEQIKHNNRYLALLIDKEIYRFDLQKPNTPQIYKLNDKIIRLWISDAGNIIVVSSNGIHEIS